MYRARITVNRDIEPEIDLGRLMTSDPNPIESELYSLDREQALLSNARDGIQLLVNSIWQQPTRIADDSVIAQLPPPSYALPREKPLPKPKPMTKWEAFAKAKGIDSNKKKDRLVFDEETQDWVPRWGYKGKNKQTEDQWIVEVPHDADDSFDPVAAARGERKARKLKNEQQRLKNAQRAAAQSATTAQARAAKDERAVAVERELKVSKKATASLGKFDPKLRGEPEREKGVKRKFEPNEIGADQERSKALRVLSKMGATHSNKRTKMSEDDPRYQRNERGLVNDRKAIKHLTKGKGALSLEHDAKKNKKGAKGKGRSKK